MTTFYLIRHGETDWNVEGIWQGHTDIPLNDVGREQARRLAARLSGDGVRFDALYSSDLSRAWETAQVVGAAVNLTPRPLRALREIDLGVWSGKTREQIAITDHETLERIASGEDLPRGGAERLVDLHDRVVGAAEHLAVLFPGAQLALVTHGGPVRALLMHAARDHDGQAPPKGHIGNTSISIVVCTPSGWQLESINDMAHLSGAAQAPDLMAPQPPGDEEAAFEQESDE